MSTVIFGVSAQASEIDAAVNLITHADATQDKIDITVNPDDGDSWITVTITDEEGNPIELIQKQVGATNNIVFSLYGVVTGVELNVKIATAPSGKCKEYKKIYYTFAQQQQAIDDLMDPTLEITQEIADVISLELDGDFALLNDAGTLFLKEQLSTQFAGQDTIEVQTFIDALNEKISLGILSGKDAGIIKSYMENNKTELGIDSLTEYTWYSALGDSGSENERMTKIVSKLATKTYPTMSDFVDAFKAENFLEKMSTEHSSAIVNFLSIHAQNQSNEGSPVNLDWTAYTALQPGQQEYFASIIAGIRYDNLTLFEADFASKLVTAGEFVEEQDPAPGTEPGATTPSTPIGTVTGGFNGSVGGGTGGVIGGIALPPTTTPGSSGTFKDLSNVSWATEAIDALYKKGVINGVDGENFDPEGIVTKEQFVKIIAGTFDIKASGEVKAFSDVPAGEWYTEFINAAVENGIVNGVSETDFGLGTNISRQDMAVIVYRVANKYGIKLSAIRDDVPADLDGVADYAKEAVSALYQAGIINGVGEGKFAPSNIATRAQAAKIIYELWRMM